MRRIFVLLLAVLCCSGCARVVVNKDPGPHDKGIRFYRPKPYLFIGPGGSAEAAKPAEKKDKLDAELVPMDAAAAANSEHLKMLSELAEIKKLVSVEAPKPTMAVTMKIEYLPDYSEEYSIRATPGLGRSKLNVQLQNGWNLNSVDAETDQKYAEIIGSMAQLAGNLKPFLDTPMHAKAEENVPLGYYEAVIAVNECGRKEMMGWRYVGFMPHLACPPKANVYRDHISCGSEPMYQIVFEDGTLKMKPMPISETRVLGEQ